MKQILLNARAFLGAADLSGDANKIEIKATRKAEDVTNYRSGGWKESLAGLGQASIDVEGQWEANDLTKPDDAQWASLGLNVGWTICPNDCTTGALAYLTNSLTTDHMLGGQVGSVAPFKVTGTSSWPLVRGIISVPLTALTSNSSGTGFMLGAMTANQMIYADLHVLSMTGTTPSLTVTIESAPDSGFTTPTTRLTMPAQTAIGGTIGRAAGPVTDTYWRAKWTVAGTSPSILALISIGIA